MARLRERQTGSIVNVPDEDADAIVALGYYEPVDSKSTSKTAAKKTTSSKSK